MRFLQKMFGRRAAAGSVQWDAPWQVAIVQEICIAMIH